MKRGPRVKSTQESWGIIVPFPPSTRASSRSMPTGDHIEKTPGESLTRSPTLLPKRAPRFIDRVFDGLLATVSISIMLAFALFFWLGLIWFLKPVWLAIWAALGG